MGKKKHTAKVVNMGGDSTVEKNKLDLPLGEGVTETLNAIDAESKRLANVIVEAVSQAVGAVITRQQVLNNLQSIAVSTVEAAGIKNAIDAQFNPDFKALTVRLAPAKQEEK